VSGRNAAWTQRAAASCLAQPHVGCGHDALQTRDLTKLRRLDMGEACLASTEQELEACEGPGSAEHHDAPIPCERVARARAARHGAAIAVNCVSEKNSRRRENRRTPLAGRPTQRPSPANDRTDHPQSGSRSSSDSDRQRIQLHLNRHEEP
jgi:hypothetical protein